MRFANGLYDDHFYQTSDDVHYYVQFSDIQEGDQPEPVVQCPQTLDWMQVILFSVGGGCGLFAIGFITYFVVINLKDYLEVRSFRNQKKDIWASENVVEPEMRKSEKRKSIRNRLSVKFSGK